MMNAICLVLIIHTKYIVKKMIIVKNIMIKFHVMIIRQKAII